MNEIKKHEGLTPETFVQKFLPLEITKTYGHIKTVAQAIKEDTNGIALYKKEYGEKAVLTLLRLNLLSLNTSINTHEKLSGEQIDEIAYEIMSTYYFLSPIEIGFIFRKAKRGDYGRINYAINMPDVLLWFSQYSEERATEFINNNTLNRSRDNSLRSEDRKILAKHEKLMNENVKK